jgi:predicted TPR repeat methyltransferase
MPHNPCFYKASAFMVSKAKRKQNRQQVYSTEAYRRGVDSTVAAFKGWVAGVVRAWPEFKKKIQDLPGTNYQLGDAYFQRGDFANAMIRFRIVIWLAPQHAQAHFKLARCMQIVGNRQGAVRHYRLAMKYRPNYTEAAYMLAVIEKGKAPDARLPLSLVQEQFDRLAPVFRTYYLERTGYTGHLAAEKAISDWVSERVRRFEDRQIRRFDVIELGCGCGVTGERMRRFARTLLGIDVSQAMLDAVPPPPEGELPLYDKMVCADFHAHLAALPHGTADIVIAAGVFNYVGDLREAIERSTQMLRPGGVLAFSIERLRQPDANLPPTNVAFEWQPERGTFAHSPGYIKELTQANGLREYRVDDILLYRNTPGHFCLFVKPDAAAA